MPHKNFDKFYNIISFNTSHCLSYSEITYFTSTLGDAVHFFTDGIAIGCAYAKSFYGGLGTTVAITCHEVPHCIGKLSIYLF